MGVKLLTRTPIQDSPIDLSHLGLDSFIQNNSHKSAMHILCFKGHLEIYLRSGPFYKWFHLVSVIC